MTTTTRYITLISNDGFEFILTRDAACVAGTIKKMLDPQSAPPLPSTPLSLTPHPTPLYSTLFFILLIHTHAHIIRDKGRLC